MRGMKPLMTAGRATLFIVFLACSSALSQDTPALKLTKVIPLPNVAGRIDHMDIDSNTGRVFVAALGNNTVEVVGLGRILYHTRRWNHPRSQQYRSIYFRYNKERSIQHLIHQFS